MKLAILSREQKNYSTKRLVEAAKKRNHKVKVLNTLKFAIDLKKDEVRLEGSVEGEITTEKEDEDPKEGKKPEEPVKPEAEKEPEVTKAPEETKP